MKLKINGFEDEIVFKEGIVNVLTIKDPKCFSHIIETLNALVEGIETTEIFLLGEDEEELNIEREIYLLFDLFHIDYNSKKVLSKIYEIIADNIEKSQDLEVARLSLELRNYIIQEINELPFEFIIKEQIDIPELLKLYNLKIDTENYGSVPERIEVLIDIISTLKIATILVVPNLKTYLSEKELIELYKYSLYNNVKILLIEREERNALKYEQNIVIDENFNDYIK